MEPDNIDGGALGLRHERPHRALAYGAAVRLSVSLLAAVFTTFAQTAPAPASATAGESHRPAYVLGTDDQLIVQVLDLDEIKSDHPLRVDMQGNIRLPIVGRLHVAGLTVEEAEGELRKRLGIILRDPEVTVLVAEFRSHPVSVLGSVKTPGVIQLTGTKTISEVLSLAGGTSPDAGNKVVITRRKETGPLPLPSARLDASGQFYIGQVNLKSLLEARHPEENIAIESGDVVSVPKGELVYALGVLIKPGGFVINDGETLSVLQVISLAGGFDRFADQKKIEILRPKAGSSDREQILVDVKAMLAAKAKDVPLQANDILFVPTSGKKAATVRGIETALGMGSSIGAGVVVYRH
jgi:polysaccharide export outer membrane protein